MRLLVAQVAFVSIRCYEKSEFLIFVVPHHIIYLKNHTHPTLAGFWSDYCDHSCVCMHIPFSFPLLKAGLGSCEHLKVLLTAGACSHISTPFAVHMLDAPGWWAPGPLLVLLTALWHLAGLLNREFCCVRKPLRVASQSKS